MTVKRFSTEKGPKALGPYCTATIAGGLIFCSGLLGIDPATGKLADGGIEAQTRQALANLRTIAGELGASMSDAVKSTVYLRDMGDFQTMNGIYKEVFDSGFPARTCIAVAGLPMGALMEIEAVFAGNGVQ